MDECGAEGAGQKKIRMGHIIVPCFSKPRNADTHAKALEAFEANTTCATISHRPTQWRWDAADDATGDGAARAVLASRQ
jgi:hypothetical protein